MKYRIKVQMDESQNEQNKYTPQFKFVLWWSCCDLDGNILTFDTLEAAKDRCIKHQIKTTTTYIYLEDDDVQ